VSRTIVTLAPSVAGIAALGAASGEELLGTCGGASAGSAGASARPALEQRAREVRRDAESVLLRVSLPGTPDARGHLTGAPRGAGTGFVYLRRYRAASARRRLEARFTRPRSESLAEREWNLLCHLRAAGVTTPEPLAVGGERRALFSARSFLVTRELDGMLRAERWFAGEPDARARRLALRAIGLCLRRVVRSGAFLPRLSTEHVFLDASEPAAHAECDRPAEVGGLGAGTGAALRWRRLPEVAIASVRGGRLFDAPPLARWSRLFERAAGDAALLELLSPRERLRLFLAATRGAFPRPARRDLAKPRIR